MVQRGAQSKAQRDSGLKSLGEFQNRALDPSLKLRLGISSGTERSSDEAYLSGGETVVEKRQRGRS